jgi:NAD+-processing family protein with receiver domain
MPDEIDQLDKDKIAAALGGERLGHVEAKSGYVGALDLAASVSAADRILFLDDDENRHRGFRQMTIGDLVDHVYTARQAIEALEKNPAYDYVYLDHDLDEYATMGQTPREETGQVVADYIAEKLPKDKYPDRVVIHSYNRPGARSMGLKIKEAGISVLLIPYRAPSSTL